MRIGLQIVIQQAKVLINAAGEKLTLPEGAILDGELSLETWDGPHGVREYEHPQFYKVEFRCTGPGRPFVYRGELIGDDLLFTDGEVLSSLPPESPFVASSEPIFEMFDANCAIRPVLDDEQFEIRAKLMSSTFTIHADDAWAVIHCSFYDGRIRGYQGAWYFRPYESLLFLEATKTYYDQEGNVEDYDVHGASYADFTFEG